MQATLANHFFKGVFMNERFIYLVFSNTPYKTGSFIRAMTHCEYNHASIALDPCLNEMYSYARYYKRAPFYAGFVRESALRYFNNGIYARVKVCKIPVTNEQYVKALAFLKDCQDNKEQHFYNFFSALVHPLHKRVNIPNSYTCVEFCCEFFRHIGIDTGIEKGKFCSVNSLMQNFDKYSLYTGQINNLFSNATWDGDTFVQKKGFWECLRLTLKTNAVMIKSMFLRNKKAH